MSLRALVPAVIVVLLCSAIGYAQDNPKTGGFLAERIKAELAKHKSQDTSFYNDYNDTLEKKIKVDIGRTKFEETIKLSVQAKTWLWIDDVKKLSVNVSRFELKGDRWHFTVIATGPLRGKAKVSVKSVTSADIEATSDATIKIEGSFGLGKAGKIAATKITALEGQLKNTKFNNQLAQAAKPYLEKALNGWLSKKAQGSLKKDLEKALDGQQLL